MTRIKPLTIEELPAETQAALEFSKQLMGYVPGSVMIMAHWPELLGAFRGLVSVIYGDSAIDNGLKRIIGAVRGCCWVSILQGAHDAGRA